MTEASPPNGNGYGRELATLASHGESTDREVGRLRGELGEVRSRIAERDRPQWQTWAAVGGVVLVIGAAACAPYISMLTTVAAQQRDDEVSGSYQRGRADERANSFQKQIDSADEESAARDHAQQVAIDTLDIRLQREMDLKNQIQDASR